MILDKKGKIVRVRGMKNSFTKSKTFFGKKALLVGHLGRGYTVWVVNGRNSKRLG